MYLQNNQIHKRILWKQHEQINITSNSYNWRCFKFIKHDHFLFTKWRVISKFEIIEGNIDKLFLYLLRRLHVLLFSANRKG